MKFTTSLENSPPEEWIERIEKGIDYEGLLREFIEASKLARMGDEEVGIAKEKLKEVREALEMAATPYEEPAERSELQIAAKVLEESSQPGDSQRYPFPIILNINGAELCIPVGTTCLVPSNSLRPGVGLEVGEDVDRCVARISSIT